MIVETVKKIVGSFSSRDDPDRPRTTDEQEDIQEQTYREDIISYVKEEFERRKQERVPFELQWQLNMNFLLGNQYCDINMYTNEIEQYDKLFWWQEREVYNHIAPIVETRMAKLGTVRPVMTVRPASSDTDDLSTAKVCTSLARSTYTKLDMQSEIGSATAWAEICGSVFYKETWSNTIGQLLGYVNNEPIYEGGISHCVVPAYEIFPDSSYNDNLQVCRSIIHAKAYHVDDIEEIWDVKLEGRDIDVFSLTNTNIGLGGLGYTSNIPKIESMTKKDHEIVIEYYERPSKRYPDGRLAIVAGDTLLHYGPMPYKNGEDCRRDFPFIRQVCVERPGCFWGISVIERLIPIQRSFNAVKNRKHEALNRVALGIFEVEEGAYDEEDLEEDGLSPGKILIRRAGKNSGSFVTPQNIPAEFTQEEDRLLNEFILISGVSELSRSSEAPTGVGSGIALQVLKEQDDTRISLTAEQVRFSIVQVGKHWLRLYKQFATGPRVLKAIGKNNDVQVAQWKASDITSDDIVLDTENELLQTPAQRKQMVYDLLQTGLLNDPETGTISNHMRHKILEILELGNWEAADNIDDLQITRAQRENMLLEQGKVPDVREYDDDDLHIIEHNRYRLSGDYEELKEQRPDLIEQFDDHVKLHEMSKTFKAQQQLASQGMLEQQEMMQQQNMIPNNEEISPM